MKESFIKSKEYEMVDNYQEKEILKESSCFSKFFFCWAFKIISLSKKKSLKTEYLGKLNEDLTSKTFFNNIYDIWERKRYKDIKKYPLLWTSVRANLGPIILIFLLTFINSALNVTSLYLFRIFIKIFTENKPLDTGNISLGAAYLIVRLVDFILQRKSAELLTKIGDKSGVELNCLVYDKLLKLSPSVEVKSGQIYNYLQSDSHKLSRLMGCCPNILNIPFLMFMYNFLLFKYMGISFIFGFLVMLIFLYVNYIYRKKFSFYLKLHMKKSDLRMRVTTETFNNLKVIKLYGWDDVFQPRIEKARNEELDALEKRYKITQISQTLLWLAPIAMSVAAIGAYQFLNDSFKIEDIFTSLGIFASIQNPMKSLPTTLDIILETLVSLGRIEKFLYQPEINKKNMICNDSETMKKNIAIQILNGTFTWGKKMDNTYKPVSEKQFVKIQSMEDPNKKNKKNKDEHIEMSSVSTSPNDEITNKIMKEIPNNTLFEKDIIEDKNIIEEPNDEELVLKNINLEVKKGEFICIIGEVGSGKTSLVQAILNNLISLTPRKTKLIVNGSISYVSQESWIQNTTVQNNILFSRALDVEKYENILRLCELKQDLNVLVGGDFTEIGEKGVNLSGGQKARISIARAMYSDGDIYIFDDPISALDAHVGKNIMINCIAGYLKDKTRILVTHALQYTSFADRIIYMKNGEINWIGKYTDLIKQPFYSDILEKVKKNEEEDKKNESNGSDEINTNKENGKKEKDLDEISVGSVGSTISSDAKKQIKRITKDEGKETGTIDKKVYFAYFEYIGGLCLILSLLFSLIIWQLLRVGSDMFLGYWSEHQKKEKNLIYFSIYASLALSSTIFNYVRTYVITNGSLKCSTRLHKEMIDNLINAPINLFHDTIPKGQIFNRLSKDLPTVDTYTMFWFMTLTSFGSSFLGAVIICSIYQPYCLFFVPFFISVCWWLSRFYMNCSRELTRIEGILNSPILNLINETIPGTATIRAYNFENKYISQFQKRVDEHFKVLYFLNGTQQWYLMMLNFASFLFLVVIVVFTLMYKETFTAKVIGILLTYCIVLQADLIEFLSSFSNFENTMTKMERSLSYTNIISERPQNTLNDNINWPTKGEIKFENYSVKYRPDTEIVLKNLTLNINSGEHVGVVGRTGSGKSTIALCLFRILEAYEGKIYIDNVDISTLGLKKLRSSLTIIPQDATIMDGTLRYNIDPIGQFNDQNIINVMSKIGFEYIIHNHPDGLSQNISENGSNLSIGEKQLICITRAILRKTKIIVMDEATASIDFKTEEIIQRAINEILKESTLITIAHRIKTVINSDKILVLDNGEIIEYDTPDNLLKNKDSFFYDFYNKSLL